MHDGQYYFYPFNIFPKEKMVSMGGGQMKLLVKCNEGSMYSSSAIRDKKTPSHLNNNIHTRSILLPPPRELHKTHALGRLWHTTSSHDPKKLLISHFPLNSQRGTALLFFPSYPHANFLLFKAAQILVLFLLLSLLLLIIHSLCCSVPLSLFLLCSPLDTPLFAVLNFYTNPYS
jgi:hypothetical protein